MGGKETVGAIANSGDRVASPPAAPALFNFAHGKPFHRFRKNHPLRWVMPDAWARLPWPARTHPRHAQHPYLRFYD